MAESKKYYWIKLKTDFFNQKEVKKLRKIAGGDTYTIIYLKLQLLSAKDDGLIKYDGTEKDLVEQLELELDEDRNNISVTLSFLQANQLIEQINDTDYLLGKACESIGKEGTSAERVRKHRSQLALQCNTDETKRNTEIEKELKIEKEIKKEKNIIHTSYELDADEISEYLAYKILKENGTAKTSESVWAKDIEKALRIDKRTKKQLMDCIDWIYTEGKFWIPNILSGKKLREKFDQLTIQMKRPQGSFAPQQTKREKSNQFIDDFFAEREANQDTICDYDGEVL